MIKHKNAIIILNYNDYKTVIEYISQIKNYKSIDKILIVDNCSTDESYKILLKYKSNKIEVIKTNKNKGYAYGNNFGIHYLENSKEYYEYITISNPDVLIDELTIKELLSYLDKNDNIAIASPTMYTNNGQRSILAAWKERKLDSDVTDSCEWLAKLHKKTHVECYNINKFKNNIFYVDCVPGSFFIIKHDVLKKVNYFDEKTFLYYEEDILCKKIKNIGYKVALLNNVKYIHYESTSINKNIKSLRKFIIFQKSKRYYHKIYNEECKGIKNYKLIKIDLATLLGIIDIVYKKSHLYKYISTINRHIKYEGLISIIIKYITYISIILLTPFKRIIRLLIRKKKICYFSLIPWKWIKQRPQFVALKLAEEFKVDYRYFDSKTKKPIEFIKINNSFQNKSLKIRPYYLHKRNKKSHKVRWNYLKLILFNYDILIFTQATQIDFILIRALKLNGTKILYDCMDNYSEWDKNPIEYEKKEIYLISKANHVFVSSNHLMSKIINNYGFKKDKITLIRNGYDSTLFNNYDLINIKLKKPSITYIGTIDSWFDIEIVYSYALKHKDIYFNIIGPINKKIINIINNYKLNNIIFYGPIEHHLVPSYILNSDIMIMPFRINNIIEYVDPVKIYEYLYFKKNIVSSYWQELDQFKDILYFYNNNNEFELAINKALNTPFKETKNYKKIINDSKWDNRLKEYIRLIKK